TASALTASALTASALTASALTVSGRNTVLCRTLRRTVCATAAQTHPDPTVTTPTSDHRHTRSYRLGDIGSGTGAPRPEPDAATLRVATTGCDFSPA
ncbi:hypothetical protein, partial [Streptomyces sp. NPDC050759]|uniref:hypothetical protein n=1 Tax=Streptomyces sp. NPDC050759 TaxID=3365635 RepID=UPI0037B060B6